MKKMRVILITLTCLLLLSSCAGRPAGQAAAREASAEDVSLESLKTADDVVSHLETVLPREGDEKLIPYAADIYHAGDNTMSWTLLGFCTPGGRIVTKPVFAGISVAELAGGSSADAPKRVFLAEIAGQPWLTAVISPEGQLLGWAMEMQGQWEPIPRDESIVMTGGWDITVCDDGNYCIDGYAVQEQDGYVYGDFAYREDGYEICRKSDGAPVGHTEWYGLLLGELPDGGRVYYTVEEGFICTYDEAFGLILRVPASDEGHRHETFAFLSPSESVDP